MNTEPLADWVTLESKKQSIPYDKFLDTMVKKTIEVRQRIVELTLETILSYDQSEKDIRTNRPRREDHRSNIPTTPCKYGECLADGVHQEVL